MRGVQPGTRGPRDDDAGGACMRRGRTLRVHFNSIGGELNMKNWRTMVGALCIIAAMVLGAFAGLAYARDVGRVGASSAAGTRGEDRHLVSAFDANKVGLSNNEAEKLAAGHDNPAKATLSETTSPEVVASDGRAPVKAVTSEDEKQMMVTPHLVQTKDGTIQVTPDTSGTRGAFPPGTINAGGPYVGIEAGKVTFTVTSNDPTVIFFQYDFNNDGIIDYPSQTGAPALGRWTTLLSITWLFMHPYFGDVMVRGWDGVSTITVFNTGDNLGQPTS